MYNVRDNIVALATVPGKAALNVVRCSGPGVSKLYSKLIKTSTPPRPNYAHLKTIYHQKNPVDQAMVVFFKAPKTFTGQDLLEFSVHGGLIIIKKLITIIENYGFRQALPGEFSYRAFINGKIDLIQAEAIGAVVGSNNNLDTLYALNNLKGSLSAKINNISKKMKNIILNMEHELDFDEEEITFVSLKEYSSKLKRLLEDASTVVGSSYLANENKNNINVCLVGKTNVGKSSLFNLLVGYSRSIVTNTPGTTTDTISAELTLNEANVSLVDTAGIRKTKARVEKEGVLRTYNIIKKADIVLFVDDRDPAKQAKKHTKLFKGKKIIYIQNKVDKNIKVLCTKTFKVSCKNKLGINSLFTALSTSINNYSSSFMLKTSFLINNRQLQIFKDFIKDISKTIQIIDKGGDLVVVVSSLHFCCDRFSSLLGYKNKEETINNIFKGFCVGK